MSTKELHILFKKKNHQRFSLEVGFITGRKKLGDSSKTKTFRTEEFFLRKGMRKEAFPKRYLSYGNET